MKILIVEDEKELAKSIAEYLIEDKFKIDIANTYTAAEENIHLHEYNCALIDLMLPPRSGLELFHLLKQHQPKCGIVIMTAKNTLEDKLAGLELGADDYLTKPFHLAELNARIKSVIRRTNFDGKNEIVLNEIVIDTVKNEVRVKGNTVELTRREYDIFLFLVSNQERVVTKESIVEYAWGNDSNVYGNIDFVYTHIKNIRKKIIEAGGSDYIHARYGIGYKFSLK
jgi:DNA-binding response OmpR family regulator